MPNNQNDLLMTEGSVFKRILNFSLPLIFGNLLQQMYNAVDSVIVGNYVDSIALAAVGASTPLIALLIAFSQGAAIGSSVIVAQYLGARNSDGVHETVHTSLALSIILGLFLTICGVVLSRPLLLWMNTPADVLEEADIFLRLYSFGLLSSVVYNMAAGILNAYGKSLRALIYLAEAVAVNIVLDIVFIAWLGFGVEGAAIATCISQSFACASILRYLVITKDDYGVNLKEITIKKRMARLIIRTGLPAAIQNTVISFSNVLVQSAVNGFGAAAVAGFGAYMKIDGFNILPVISFSIAITTFVGQNYGAGKIERIKRGMRAVLAMGIIYCVITGVLLLKFSYSIMSFFSNDLEVMEFGHQAMLYFCPFYWLLAILQGLAGTIRGAGKSIPPMMILLVSLCLFRIFWVKFILPYFTDISGIYILYPVSWFVGTVLMIIYVWKVNWLKKCSDF